MSGNHLSGYFLVFDMASSILGLLIKNERSSTMKSPDNCLLRALRPTLMKLSSVEGLYTVILDKSLRVAIRDFMPKGEFDPGTGDWELSKPI